MILAVALTHLAKLRRDRAAFVLSFVLPVVFFTVFAFVFGGRGATRRVPLVVADEDRTAGSRRFVEALGSETGLRIVRAPGGAGTKAGALYDRARAEDAVRSGRVSVALVVPAGFSQTAIRFGTPGPGPSLLLLADSSDPVAAQMVAGLIQKAALTSSPDSLAKAGLDALDHWGGGVTAEQRRRMEEAFSQIPAGGKAAGTGGGLVRVEVRDVLGETKKNPTAALLAAGLGVMFLLFSAAGAGGALIEEAESGTLDRILSTRVSMTRLLLGKLLYLAVVAVLQLLIMFVWGEIFFGVELHSHLPGFFVMTAVTAIAASCFGLLLAAACRTRMQLVALSNLLILVMSALGGSMVPRALLSESIQKAGLWTLNAWAIDGFLKVFWREEPVWNLWPQVCVLGAASLLLFAAARRLARRWEIA